MTCLFVRFVYQKEAAWLTSSYYALPDNYRNPLQ